MPNQIRIEGHTDDKTPPDKKFATNWELSTWRATALVRWFIDTFKMQSKRFIAVGYGDNRPVADNSTEEGRKLNRRVDIILLSNDAVAKQGYSPTMPSHVPMKVQMPKNVNESSVDTSTNTVAPLTHAAKEENHPASDSTHH